MVKEVGLGVSIVCTAPVTREFSFLLLELKTSFTFNYEVMAQVGEENTNSKSW